MAYQANRNNQNNSQEQQEQPKTKKEQNRENTKETLKDAGEVALEANGVPGPLAQTAVNEVSKNKNVNKAVDKVSDTLHKNPVVSKAINTYANMPERQAIKSAVGGGVSGGNVPQNGAPGTNSNSNISTPNSNSGSSMNGGANKSSTNTSSLGKTNGFQRKNLFGGEGTQDGQASGEGEFSSGINEIANIIGKIKKVPPFMWPVIGIGALILLVLLVIVALISQFLPMFGTDTATGLGSEDLAYVASNPEEAKMYETINEVYQEYKDDGADFDPNIITSVFYTINRYNSDFDYSKMDKDMVKEIADLMFKESKINLSCKDSSGNIKTVEGKDDVSCPSGSTEESRSTIFIYDEDSFKSELKTFLDNNIDNAIDTDKVADDIFTMVQNYYEFIGSDRQSGDNVSNFINGCYVNGNTQASSLKGKSHDEILAILGPLMQADYSRSGILASVSLGQFILESGWGEHTIDDGNNLFGIKCESTVKGIQKDCKTVTTSEEYTTGEKTQIQAAFMTYPSVEASIDDHSALLSLSRYDGIKSAKTPKEQLEILHKGGYATSSTYVEDVLKIINDYDLTKWDVITNTTSVALTCITDAPWSIRSIKPTASDPAFNYKNANRGQCVWYAQARAIEIVEELGDNGDLSSDVVANIRNKLLSVYGNAEAWYTNTRSLFKGSDKIKDVKSGSIIVWGGGSTMCTPLCGHVAIIEEVDVKRNTIIITDGWASSGDSCPNNWNCVEFRYRSMQLNEFYVQGEHNFGSYGGSMFFKGYVYFLEPLS